MELDSGSVYAYAADLLKEDLGRGDITTQHVVRGGQRARGTFLTKEDLVLCGLELAEAVFASLDNNIRLESHAYDGDRIKSHAEFARIEGPAAVLLIGERTALNLMERLSGVATLTRAYVDRIEGTGAKIVDTRKTTPGLRMLEKYAVGIGGGFNHRFGLDDGVLIKDNHIAIAGSVRRAIELARAGAPHLMKIEVEVSSKAQLKDALTAQADVVMLDNMEIADIRECVALIREEAAGTLIEASGRVSLENVKDIAECGVDLISVGAITHSAPSVDISLKIKPL